MRIIVRQLGTRLACRIDLEGRMETNAESFSPPGAMDLSVDLLVASYRSASFPQDWSREARERELARYVRFLLLSAKSPGHRATPTREIDEFWHLHMLQPVAYYRDCQRIFGRLFDHDGGFGTGPGELPILQAAFREFAKRWLAEYGEPYVESTASGDAGATSCWHDCANRCWHACSS